MLVLTRKSDQKIMIGKNIVITILKVQGDQVSVGIEAPESIQILREEIYWEIQKENAEGLIQGKDLVDIKSLAKNLHFKEENRPAAHTDKSLAKKNE